MKRTTNTALVLALLAGGTIAAIPSAAKADAAVINISGATLFRNFFLAPASTNEFFDINGDGFSPADGNQFPPTQLAPFLGSVSMTAMNAEWTVMYRSTGSGNGIAEFVEWGQTFATLPAADGELTGAEDAYFNRQQYIAASAPQTANGYDFDNPGGAPVRALFSNLEATTTGTPANSGIRMDMAVTDVPVAWFSNQPGEPAFDRNPGQPGYGVNPREARNLDGTLNGQSNDLIDLGNLNLDIANPDANTVYDTQVALVPIAAITNFGTGMSEIDMQDLRYLSLSGRMSTGENLVFVTRDSGSGTRNGFQSSIGVEPSWGVGENVGPKINDNPSRLLGPNFVPSNAGGSSTMEGRVRNHRLAIGYTGAERGNGSWLDAGQLDALGVRNDGGSNYARPNIDNVLDNDVDGYRIGGPETFATVGDPRAESMPGGDAGNTNPAMANPAAAAYLNNITRSIEAFVDLPGNDDTLFTPGEFLALSFTLTSSTDFIQDALDPDNWIPNPALNQALQDYIRANNIDLADPGLADGAFGTYSTTGRVPTRTTGVTYTDGVVNGQNYIDQAGNDVTYGASLSARNRIAGDFNNDGLRDINDAAGLVAAWNDRNGGPAWAAGTSAVIEILGDFNGDGNFNSDDVRYWADGLAMVNGQLDRKAGYTAVDDAFGDNFFGTTKATGASYVAGDSRADISNAEGREARGWAPVGADGVIDANDIDYVQANLGDWSNLADASLIDLSADINGDLIVDQADLCELVTEILGTSYGDVNLDGVVDIADETIVMNGITVQPEDMGWATGDLNGDGVVDQTDLDIVLGLIDPCAPTIDCPGDATGDNTVDLADLNLVLANFGQATSSGDVTGDDNVDLADLNLVLANFGTNCN